VTSSVSIVRCKDYDRERVNEAVRKAVDLLGGMHVFIKPGDRVLIKPNMLKARPPEAAVTTHPEIVRAAIRLVAQAGGVPIVGDSPGIGEITDVARRSGILAAVEEEGASLADFNDVITVNGNGKFRHFEIASCALNADAIINLPKLKTHGMMVLTGAVKNLFGCIPGKRKAQWHLNAGIDHRYFAQMLVELSMLLKPRLNILDAVIGMEGNGPGSGHPRPIGLILAGRDPVSLDVASGAILGLSPLQVPVTSIARETGTGESRLECIPILGKPISEVKIKDFILPQLMNTEWPIPEWARRCLKDAFTTRPIINNDVCIRCGICRDDCPRAAISERDGGMIIDYRNCIRCFCCQEFCPDGAIEVGKGWMLKFAGKSKL
jgi:uncharacterized protein (DUF362 family)/Pyruvate/2-oxoacid:ferredoxin oxidoreductase delta subunit